MFAPPPGGFDFREAHVFDFSPKFWHEQTPRDRRELLAPVAAPEDTVIDCKRERLAFRCCCRSCLTFSSSSSPPLFLCAKYACLRCAKRETLNLSPFCTVTPNYSVVGEAPLRISDFYGVDGSNDGRLRRNLRFLVVLREPVARTISSWQYKSERKCINPLLL